MQNNNNVPPLLGLLAAAVVIASVLQGIGAWASKLGEKLEPYIRSFQYWALLVLVVLAIVLFLYELFWGVITFNDFVNRVDIRGIGNEHQLKELRPVVERYQTDIWALENEIERLRGRLESLEEETKKAKEKPDSVVGAAVSEILKR